MRRNKRWCCPKSMTMRHDRRGKELMVELLIRRLPSMANGLPHMALCTEEGEFLNIIQQMIAGTVDMAVLFRPPLRPRQ